MAPDPALLAAHRHATRQRPALEASGRAGCFHCLSTYAPTRVLEWIDGGATAVCPRCGVDAVLGDASGYPLDRASLARLRAYFFRAA